MRIDKSELNHLIALLIELGYSVVGPRVEDSAIVYAEIDSADDLPRGYRDVQEAGRYRLQKSDSGNYFEFNVGPHSWKQFLFPPSVTIASAQKEQAGWVFETAGCIPGGEPRYAFLGVRACELAAIAIQDRVFLRGSYVDPIYKQRRDSAFLVAVNCTVAAATCFCTSMNTGPKCQLSGENGCIFDIALTELEDSFVVEVGTERGRSVVGQLRGSVATDADLESARILQQRAVEQIERKLDTDNIRNLLLTNLEHPRWDDIATRCLSCTNCTMVCPTCFCSSVSEVTDLTGERVERKREWDSCFNIDFAYTASGVVRNDRRSRFRQWLTHKLASWHDQFDSSGCVGCGRCITWCPVGIDLTEEVSAIRCTPSSGRVLPLGEPESRTACVVPESDK